MDSSTGPSTLDPRPSASTPHTCTNPFNTPADGNRRIDGRLGDLRRGYSDEDVIPGRTGFHSRRTTDETLRDGETWMDFLRQSSSSAHNPEERAQIATRRAAIMAADRKRRLTGQQEEQSRRRSSSSQSFGQTSRDRMWQSLSQSTSLHPLAGPLTGSDTRSGSRITDRPLPPRPLRRPSQSRLAPEIRLPRWQPDAEVGRCPICNTTFSFWYRKHHCRKCGRVVCASCSPHRITIPRQFIVHSPSECGQDAYGTAIIDLTSGNEDDAARPSSSSVTGRRRSQEIRLDPALGGGQEVRLCNPCVPDPNPLPHVTFTPPHRYIFNSFPAPETIARATQHPQQQPGSTSDVQRNPSPPSRTGYGRQYFHSSHAPDSAANHERHSNSSPFVGASATSRRQNGAFRPPGSHPPPNYASLYGSVPNPSVHERFLGSLLQEHQPLHHRHRHHNSVSIVPSSSRHSSMLDVQTSLPARAAPQPVLREEDECPICHNALPPKGPDGSEETREAHVAACIESHFSTSTSPQVSRLAASAVTAAALAVTEAAVMASVATPSQPNRGSSHPYIPRAESLQDPVTAQSMPRRRTTGMVVYHASEKDCVNEEGEGAQECVICFEDFAVGAEMGRLECLCKFHKVCIRQWWDTKGVGACPVHQGDI